VSRIATIAVTLLDGTVCQGGWIDLFKIGSEVHYKGERFELDAAFAQRVVSNHQRFCEQYGKEPPMLRQHEREGWQYGAWSQMRLTADGRIQGLAAFLDERTLTLYTNNQLREWSPGFGDIEDPHTGEVWQDLMVEASFVDRGHQWNLRPPSMTNPPALLAAAQLNTFEVITMAEDNQTEIELDDDAADDSESEAFDIAAAFGGLTDLLSGIVEQQAAILDILAPEAEMSAPDEVSTLRSELNDLKRTNTLLDLERRGITGKSADALASLKLLDVVSFEAALPELQKRFSQPSAHIQAEIGQTGTMGVGAMGADDVIELAKAAGCIEGNGSITVWVADNHPAAFNEVSQKLGHGNLD